MSSSDKSAVAAYVIACKKHGVKRPNPAVLKFFKDEEPIAEDIEDLDLSGNYIGNRGILALLDVIESSLPNFRCLNISNQKLYNTDLSEDSVKGNATVDRIVDVLKAHPTANALDISNNPISNYAGRKLLGLVQLNSRMCRVELHDTRVDFDLRKRIQSQCEKNTVALWENQGSTPEPEEDAPFGEHKQWAPATKGADLTALGAAKVRRATVRSEGIDPEEAKKYVPPVIEKSEAETRLICELLSRNVLFGFLTSKDLKGVAGAMQQKIFYKDDVVMAQGSISNTLYIIQFGNADIIKEGQKVFVKVEGTAVGEIELMYDTPCVATVRVSSERLVTWALDRETYRNLVMGTAIRRRETYMKHLEAVPFLESLGSYEKLQVADALSSDEYQAGDHIIRYDTEGEWMFIILEGVVEVFGRDGEGQSTKVCEFKEGDYIGELEFLNNHRTVADVVAKTEVHTAKLNRRHFEMCLGPVMELLKRNTHHPKYEYYQNVLSKNSQ
jgi:CRP-like cAMP-binding protein